MSFPRYPEYKDSGLAWLDHIPSTWKLTSLKHGYSVTLGKMLQTDQKTDADQLLPYLRAANIQTKGVDISDVRKMWMSPADVQNLRLQVGDLLVSEGGDVGRPAIWRYDKEMYIQNSVNRVRALKGNCTKFLFYWITALKSKGFIDVVCNKSTIAHFTAEKVAAVPTPFPTDVEQVQIARFLDHETAKIDALIQEQERLIELLQEKRQAVISHAVTKGLDPDVPMKDSGVEWLGEVPEHWKRCSLKFLVIPADGIQMGPFGGMLKELEEQPTGFKVYGQENTITGDFSRGSRWIAPDRFNRLGSYHLGEGDIVLTRKGSLGNARLIGELPQPGIIDSDTIRVRVDSQKLLPHFLEILLHQSSYISEQIRVTKRGAILAGLNSETIAGLSVVAPPIEEQEELIIYIRENTRTFDDAVSCSHTTIEILRERRSALISAAVTGKIDVRDWQPPADESAFEEEVLQAGMEAMA